MVNKPKTNFLLIGKYLREKIMLEPKPSSEATGVADIESESEKMALKDLTDSVAVLAKVLQKFPEINDVLIFDLSYSQLSEKEKLILEQIFSGINLGVSQHVATVDFKKQHAGSEEKFENMQKALESIVDLFNKFPKLARCFSYEVPSFSSETGEAYTNEQKKKLKEVAESMQKLKVENTRAEYQNPVSDEEFGKLRDKLVSMQALLKKSPELSFFVTIKFDYNDNFSGETGDQYEKRQKVELSRIINLLKEAKKSARVDRIGDMNHTYEQFVELEDSLNIVKKMLGDYSSDLSKFIRLSLPWKNTSETYELPYTDKQKDLLAKTINS